MKSAIILLAAAMLLPLAGSGNVRADISFGLSASDEGVNSFYLAVGDYYRIPEKEVVVVHERRIPDDDLPVVFFLARRAKVAPDVIVNMRLGGKSWMDISLHYGLGPEIYYVPVTVEVAGPPYGKAYGYYKNKPRKEWKEIRLADDDVVNLVNLRFLSEHYGYSADKVVKMRSSGNSFKDINKEFKKNKESGKDKKTVKDNSKTKSGKKADGKSKASQGKSHKDNGHGKTKK